jgi:hypothetical protein
MTTKRVHTRGLWRVRRGERGEYAIAAPRARSADVHVLPASPHAPVSRRVAATVQAHGVAIVGTPAAVEDYLDQREIDRRLADPANQRRLSWEEVKARRGL